MADFWRDIFTPPSERQLVNDPTYGDWTPSEAGSGSYEDAFDEDPTRYRMYADPEWGYGGYLKYDGSDGTSPQWLVTVPASDPPADEYEVEAWFRWGSLGSSTTRVAVHARMTTTGDFWQHETHDGYRFSMSSDGSWTLDRGPTPSVTTLASGNEGTTGLNAYGPSGGLNQFVLRVEDVAGPATRLTAWVNGNLIVQYDDTDAGRKTTGRAGLSLQRTGQKAYELIMRTLAGAGAAVKAHNYRRNRR